MSHHLVTSKSLPPEKLDKAGAITSLVCAIHCALMPLVVTLLPLLGLGFLASEPAEWLLLGLSATLGILSLCWGFRTHRSRRALAVLGVAIAFWVLARLAQAPYLDKFEPILMIGGGLAMAAAHFLNRRLCIACRSC